MCECDRIASAGHSKCKLTSCCVSKDSYCIGLSRYIATATLAIIAVFLEYLGHFLIDLHQIYRHSSVQ